MSTPPSRMQLAISNGTYSSNIALICGWERLRLPVMSTGRTFDFYRRCLFNDEPAADLLARLRGQVLVDIGCGHTPYLSDSMFQECERNGIDFYGIDPKLDGDLKNNVYDRFLRRVTGARGTYDRSAPGTERKAIAGYANDLPFADGSVDCVMSSYLMFVWLRDETILEQTMREFDRVLKPGGTIRLYPQPTWDRIEARAPAAAAAVAHYDIQQHFYSGVGSSSVPAMVTTATKPH